MQGAGKAPPAPSPPLKKISKKFKKGVDKNKKMCYNKSVKGGKPLTIKNTGDDLHQKGNDTMQKLTKKDNFTAIISVLESANRPDLVAVMEHEIALLDKKAESRSSKPTVRQAENASIKDEILMKLVYGQFYRCAEIKAMIPALDEGEGTQRTARLCNDLVSEGKLQKKIDKKVVYFALAE